MLRIFGCIWAMWGKVGILLYLRNRNILVKFCVRKIKRRRKNSFYLKEEYIAHSGNTYTKNIHKQS